MTDARADPPCVLCGATAWTPKAVVDATAIVSCRACGIVRQLRVPRSPETMYDVGYFASDRPKGGYANYFLDAPINRRTFERRLRAIERRSGRRGRLLDVGCALGDFVLAAAASGWRAEGVEVSAYAASEAVGRGAVVHHGTIEDLPLEEGSYDVITLYDSIEHMVDPMAALRRVRRLLAPGGLVHVVTPNVEGLQARSLGRRWYHYKPDEHLFYFSPRTLRRAVTGAGLGWEGSARTGSYVTVAYVLGRLRAYSPAFGWLGRAALALGLDRPVFYLYAGEMEAWARREA